MTIEELRDWIVGHKEELIGSLLAGSYEPKAVRAVEIPKAGGGMRQLGIPTVVDRLVQQAIFKSSIRLLIRPSRTRAMASVRAVALIRL